MTMADIGMRSKASRDIAIQKRRTIAETSR